MKKLVIFDYDGTLIDSMEDAVACLNIALKEYNFPPIENNHSNNFETIFKAQIEKISKYYTKEEISSFRTQFNKIYSNHPKENTKPFPGIPKLLRKLQDKDYILAINSNKNNASIKSFNEKYFKDIEFKEIKGYDGKNPSKPNPKQVFNIIESVKLTKEETIYIGDSINDILTAQNAGIDLILVSWGQSSKKDLENEYVKKVVNNTQEIYEFLKE